MRLTLLTGDITRLRVDAIVNAANEWLLGGGGVDGAIHDAAGEELLEACRAIPEVSPGVRCPIGGARITPGFSLPSRFVIHTVGPRWRGGAQGEDEALASAYRSSIALAEENGLKTIAFPAISTGIFGFPVERAAMIAVQTVTLALEKHPTIEQVILVSFDDRTRRAYDNALASVALL